MVLGSGHMGEILGFIYREREKEMFYLTTHSTHFIYGYMASDIWLRTILIVRKETRCGGPWTAFSSEAVETHPTLEYPVPTKGDKTYVEAPWMWRPLGNCPAYPVLNPTLHISLQGRVEGRGGGGCLPFQSHTTFCI